MKIDEFLIIMSFDLAEFKADWEARRRESPDKFPDKMGEADWFEQFIFFIEERNIKNDDPTCR